jgi:Spy/CpxP family protein refolding chaperone
MIGTRRAILYLLLVFALGAVVGGLATHWASRRGWAEERSGHHRDPRGALEWLDRELKLTPEQRVQVEAILDETGQAYRAIRQRTRPEYEAAREAGRNKIRAVLSEEQRRRFEELVQEIDARRRERQREENR